MKRTILLATYHSVVKKVDSVRQPIMEVAEDKDEASEGARQVRHTKIKDHQIQPARLPSAIKFLKDLRQRQSNQ
eukprot:338100-Amphidinium_carterae.3